MEPLDSNIFILAYSHSRTFQENVQTSVHVWKQNVWTQLTPKQIRIKLHNYEPSLEVS